MVMIMNDFSLNIDKSEVLRYLGYKNQVIDEKLDELIDSCRKEIKEIIKPKYVIDFFDLIKKEGVIILKNSSLILKGEDINKHLKESSKAMLLAVTLGSEVDRKINYYEKIDLTHALILDACATQAVEEVCDIVENSIRQELNKENKDLTYRFSAGYGDLSIDIQRDFLDVLNAQKKIGLTATEENILIPRKSVTAIMGVVDNRIENRKIGCIGCSKYNDCNFRGVGEGCGG